MKIVRFRTKQGLSYGLRVDGGLIDLDSRLPYPDVEAMLNDPEGLSNARRCADGASADVAFDRIEAWYPPVGAPEKILCIGVNYDTHRRETGRDPSAYPTVFARFAHTLVGHGQPMVRPRASERFDYEGELAVIIGRRGRHISQADALDYVAGYACFNDGSVRDYQRHTSQFTPGKNFDATGGFGPWLLTADEVPDPQALALQTRVGGEVLQSASTSHMIFDVRTLIAYLSSFCTLAPGDIIATGTPGGVGDKRDPRRYLVPGEQCEVVIDGIGTLSNPIQAEI